MIRVAFLTPSLHTGGAERFILTLARHFQHCQAVAVIQLPMSAFDSKGKVKPILRHHTDPNIDRQMAQVMRIERLKVYGEDVQLMVARGCRDADVLISWGIADLAMYTRHVPIPVIEVSHASGEWEEQQTITATSYLGAFSLFAVSQAARSAFPLHQQSRVNVINNGIDVEHVMLRHGREHQRAEWGITPDQKIALFLGRFADVKRPELFVHAVAVLPDDWRGVMIGHGPTEDATLQLAGELCSGKILFPGTVAHAGDAFAGADVFVMTSKAEGHPLTLTEAWIAGKPAVSTPFDFLTEAERLLGMPPCIVAMPTPGGIADAVIEASNDLACDSRRDVAMAKFSASAMAAKWEYALSAIVQGWDAARI